MLRTACVSALILSAASGFSFYFSDTEFATGSWQVTNGFPDDYIVQTTSGGNPGAFGQFSATTSGLPDWNNYFRPDFVYDPGVSGPLTLLRMGFDAKYLSGWREGAYPRIGFMVMQNGTAWWSSVGQLQLGWTHYERELVATNLFHPYPQEPGHPDFSANGAPITFGIMFWAAYDFSPPVVTVGGFDNFFATSEALPEPATVLAMALGLAAMRKRRRSTAP